jgi:hypothetical protein
MGDRRIKLKIANKKISIEVFAATGLNEMLLGRQRRQNLDVAAANT